MACATFHDETFRNVKAKRVQCDEIWSFTYAKAKGVKTAKAAPEGAGDTWTWTALDSDTKLMISWRVGGRDSNTGYQFLADLESRLADHIQLTSDGHPAYLQAVPAAFGDDVDFAQLVKIYRASPTSFKGRYSPADWMWKHRALGATPAMAAALTDKVMTMTELVELMDAREFDALQDKRKRILSLPYRGITE